MKTLPPTFAVQLTPKLSNGAYREDSQTLGAGDAAGSRRLDGGHAPGHGETHPVRDAERPAKGGLVFSHSLRSEPGARQGSQARVGRGFLASRRRFATAPCRAAQPAGPARVSACAARTARVPNCKCCLAEHSRHNASLLGSWARHSSHNRPTIVITTRPTSPTK
jgi:hypothetical protein